MKPYDAIDANWEVCSCKDVRLKEVDHVGIHERPQKNPRKGSARKQRRNKLEPQGSSKRALPPWRGAFVDVLVAGKALLGEGRLSLETLGLRLKVEHPKLEQPEFSRPLTKEQLRYAARDPLTTAECYFALQRQYRGLQLPQPLHFVYSEASISKGHLEKMKIAPWTKAQPGFDPEIIGYMMSTYVAGRTDTKIRREIRRVIYCDFTSLYPTGCILQKLWKYIIAGGVAVEGATAPVQKFLDSIALDDLQDPETWRNFVCIAQIQPSNDILPVRGQYGRRPGRRIGWNFLSQDEYDHLLWFTLADLVASKLLTGRTPKIVRAVAFSALV